MNARLCFILLLIVPFLTVRGQETVDKKSIVNDHYIAKYHVLKSNKKIKHGPYQVFSRDTVIVEGMYENGKRVGRWNFRSYNGRVQQRFNFSSNQLEYHEPDTAILQFRIEHPLKPGDTVNYPAKIGSNPLTFYKFIMKSMVDYRLRRKTGEFILFNIFYLDESGKLIKWQKKIASLNLNLVSEEGFSNFHPDDLLFTPARVNGQTVPSVIIHKAMLKTSVSISVRP